MGDCRPVGHFYRHGGYFAKDRNVRDGLQRRSTLVYIGSSTVTLDFLPVYDRWLGHLLDNHDSIRFDKADAGSASSGQQWRHHLWRRVAV